MVTVSKFRHRSYNRHMISGPLSTNQMVYGRELKRGKNHHKVKNTQSINGQQKLRLNKAMHRIGRPRTTRWGKQNDHGICVNV